ncbi:hypothetical protein AXF42_Ash021349 [Apostasia shenzhenica]|uniref:Uncharacterized protein n=1 Tax=Apostasia shenzhenica TaxID=1088818 RepID=A0A2H9ZSN2_9ASPA|nr:hypothetical protein AXF42_Ash021349 [Apostasia shenzhenica]
MRSLDEEPAARIGMRSVALCLRKRRVEERVVFGRPVTRRRWWIDWNEPLRRISLRRRPPNDDRANSLPRALLSRGWRCPRSRDVRSGGGTR